MHKQNLSNLVKVVAWIDGMFNFLAIKLKQANSSRYLIMIAKMNKLALGILYYVVPLKEPWISVVF